MQPYIPEQEKEQEEDKEGSQEEEEFINKRTVNQDGEEREEIIREPEPQYTNPENPEEVYVPGLGHVNGALPYDELDDGVPYIAGSFTGWRYKKMQRVYDICGSFDSDYLEPFERCKAYYTQFKTRNFKSPEDLKKKEHIVERKQYNDMRLRSAKDFTFGAQGWVKEFKNHMPYKKPFVVNGFEINDLFKE
jgi:hypothetical protein